MSFRNPITVLLFVCALDVGCGHDVIPNTDVEDTEANREVIGFVEKYRKAVELRDADAMLGMASTQYFDDNGSPDAKDDVDFRGLKQRLSRWEDAVLDVRYEIRYRRVIYRGARILVDYTYTGSFRIKTPEDEHWDRRIADNRLILTKEAGQLRFLSGM